MKTTIEVNGYEIVISEQENGVLVSATKDGEIVEEFNLDLESVELEETEAGEEVEADLEDDFSEDDFDAEEESEEEVEEDDVKLESFTTFIKKNKK